MTADAVGVAADADDGNCGIFYISGNTGDGFVIRILANDNRLRFSQTGDGKICHNAVVPVHHSCVRYIRV